MASHLNRENLQPDQSKVTAQVLGALLCRVNEKIISGKAAKEILHRLWNGEAAGVDDLIQKLGLKQITDDAALQKVIRKIVDTHPDQSRQFQEGNKKVLGYLVGQALKATAGKADPKKVNAMLRKTLSG